MTGLTSLTALTISAAVAFGLVVTFLGSIKTSLAKRLGIDEARAGGLLSALNLALIPMMLLAGLLIDNWGAREVVLVGSVLTALALFSLALRNTYAWALLSVLLVGLGGACLGAGSMVLMPEAFFPREVGELPNREAAALLLGNVFFGLGCLITPTLADLLLRTVRFRWTLGVLALVCLVPAALAVAASVPAAPAGRTHGDLGAVLLHPLVWLAGVVFFLYGPVEFSTGTWATGFLTGQGFRPSRAAWLLSGFWVTFFGARLALAYLEAQDVLPKHNEPWMIALLALLAAVALGNLAGTAARGNAAVGLLVLGACLGPIFPTLLAAVFQAPDLADHRGTAYGLVFALGSVGSLVTAPLVSASARRTSPQHAFRILMLLALLLTAAALVLGLARPQF
jgi:MFS family permease